MGEKNPNYHKPITPQRREKLSRAFRGSNNPMYGVHRPHTEEEKEKARKSTTRLWQDPEYRNKTVSGIMKGLAMSPNKPEQSLLGILNELFPGEYEFVGDGKLVIYGYCPDFSNVNGQKKLIELFGDYWHKDEDPKIKQSFYGRFGYKTLVVWEHELKEPGKLRERLIEFNGEGEKCLSV